MNIDINITHQEKNTFRKIYQILCLLTIFYVGFSYLVLEVYLHQYLFFWILFILMIVDFIFYVFEKIGLFPNSFAYLRINEEKIEKRNAGFFAKPETIYWVNVQGIDIKLFEIQLTTTSGKHISLDLANLTENNLKNCKGICKGY